jgi:O-antigen ligase
MKFRWRRKPPLKSSGRVPDGLAPLILFSSFLVLAAMFGGASRADSLSQVLVRAVAIVMACVALLMANRTAWRGYGIVLVFIACFGALMAIQLIPLPPGMWTALPGRALLAQAAPLAGLEQPWRPISIMPDATINSLLSLLPGLAAILLFANVPPRHWPPILFLLLGIAMLSGLLGLVQVSTQLDWLYPYRITNDGTAVGLFANRNHQAVLLAMIYPLLGAIAAHLGVTQREKATSRFMLFMVGLFLVPLILATGSRAGIVLVLIGILSAILLIHRAPDTRSTRSGILRFPIWIWVSAILAMVALVFVTLYFSRGEAVQRLFERDLAEDKRFISFWPMVEMAKIYFPFGTGFGSFPDIFRIHEPLESLGPTYMNHAHNDLLELVIEGGLAGVLLLAIFVGWIVKGAYNAWAPGAETGTGGLLARLGSIFIAMMMLSSLADYPLRTPTLSVLFLLSCCWLARHRRHAKRAVQDRPAAA